MTHPDFQISLDELEQNLISLARNLNQVEYRFLVKVRAFDLRQGWKAYHFNNCAEWLNMKCGIQPGTGREKVRVAHALFNLPLIARHFEAGDLSYSKVRAMTRCGEVCDEQVLIDFAMGATAHQVDDYCRQVRNADKKTSTPDANRAFAGRSLSRTCHPNRTMSIHIELPQEMSDVVMKAVETAMAHAPSLPQDDLFQQQADALFEMASVFLARGKTESETGRETKGEADTQVAQRETHQIVVHVSETALKDEGGKSGLPIETVKRLACDAHHVMHWSEGGETSLDNLLLLCSRHHRLLHEGGLSISKHHDGDIYFRHSNGKLLVEGAYQEVALSDEAFDASCDAWLASLLNTGSIREPGALYG